MKLLFDENLSPRLVGALADVYSGSAHVHQCGLGSTDDEAIWQYAKDNGFAIVSKDSDFQERSVLRGRPPKIIWLRATNCSSAEIESLLRAAVLLGSFSWTKSHAWSWEFEPGPSSSFPPGAFS